MADTHTVETVTLEVSRGGERGALQLSVNANLADGYGHGYRLAGPKFCGCHPSKAVLVRVLDQRDIDELRRYVDLAQAALNAAASA